MNRPPLHPEAVAFLAMLNRPGAAPFHTQPLDVQRSASEKMLFAFRLPLAEVQSAHEGWLPRAEAAGGPLRYRLYRPLGAAPDAALPALLWIHGGGWTLGNIESYDGVCRDLAAQSGCAVFSLAYRLAPEHPFPAALDDVRFALTHLRDHGADFGIDASRLAIGGDSAGGNLSAASALRCREEGGPALAFQLLVYPSTDQRSRRDSHRDFADGHLLTQASIRGFQANYFRHEADYMDWRASPLLAPSLAGLPPALVIVASHDPLADDCRAYADRLAAEGVAVELAEYPGMIHGFFTLTKAFSDARAAVARSADALRRHLHP